MNDMILPFRKQAFSISIAVTIFLLIASCILGFYFDQLLLSVLIGIPSVLIPFFLYKLLGDHIMSRSAYAASYMILTALHIQLLSGKLEMHFGIFVLLAVLTAFRDKWTILVGAAVIAVHHFSFMYLQHNGYPFFVMPDHENMLATTFLHAFYVIAESAVLMFISHKSLQEGLIGQSLSDATINMHKDSKIDLRVRASIIDSTVTDSFNNSIEQIGKTIVTIDQSTKDISKESFGLLATGNDIADGMSKKLREIERIAAATDEMSKSIKSLSDLSKQLADLANQTEQTAVDGDGAVNTSLLSVNQLTDALNQTAIKVENVASATQDITQVLEVITNIADQTNLLALNAAIEAARAGEQGRGFAVVADEVRTLASKTKDSTTEIRQIIERLISNSEQSVEDVKSCLEQLEKTRHATLNSQQVLQAILAQSKEVFSSSLTMSSAIAQQSQASEEVSMSANSLMTMASEQNGQGQMLVTQANNLNSITVTLDKEVSKFAY